MRAADLLGQATGVAVRAGRAAGRRQGAAGTPRSAVRGRPGSPDPPSMPLRLARRVRGGSLTVRRLVHYATLCSVGATLYISQWAKWLIGEVERGEWWAALPHAGTFGVFFDPPPRVSPALRFWDRTTDVLFLLVLAYAAVWVTSDWLCRRAEGGGPGIIRPIAAVAGVNTAIYLFLVLLQHTLSGI